MSEKNPALALDPGVPVVRQRRPSLLKCCCWLTALVFAGIVLIMLYTLVQGANTLRKEEWSPHRALYYNVSPDEPPDRYLLPMIDDQQLFDIGVTVWIRQTEEEEEEYRKVHQVTDDDELPEMPLYSGVPLTGLRLSDKGVTTQVAFRIPTARFHGKNLTRLDLRGSFVIIPTSPSPLDYVTGFSNYLQPQFMGQTYPRVKYWPARPLEDSQAEMLREKAIDTMSAQVPLVAFYDMDNPCKLNTTEAAGNSSSSANGTRYITDVVPPGRQPYIITRTQLRIRKETHPLHAQNVNNSALAVAFSACERPFNDVHTPPPRAKCYRQARQYGKRGHWETIYTLQYPDEMSESGIRQERRYSPYMDTMRFGHTPKDLVRVPVSRHNCSTNATVSDSDVDPSYMNVTWTISFSGRSPAKAVLADGLMFEPAPFDAHSAKGDKILSDSVNMKTQELLEMWQGVLGHRHRADDHPRRRMTLNTFLVVMDALAGLIGLHYWYTRRTTVGISLPTARLAFTVWFAKWLWDGCRAIWGQTTLTVILIAVLSVLSELTMWAMAATLWTLGCHRSWKCIPVVRSRALTHRERASQRLDGRLPIANKIWLFIALTAVYMVCPPWDIWLVSPGRYAPPVQFSDTYWIKAVDRLLLAGIQSALLTRNTLQALLNARGHTFAGSYRSVPFLRAVRAWLRWLPIAENVMGRTETHVGVSLHYVLVLASWAILAGQAVWLPGVKQDAAEEDE